MTIYTIDEECSDAFYGFYHVEFFLSKEKRDVCFDELVNENKGISYEKSEVEVVE